MNISIIVGTVIAFAMVALGIGGSFGLFVEVNSLFITVGGTLGVLIAMFPFSVLKNVPKALKIAIFPPKYNHRKYIDEIVEYAKIARSKGLIALESSAIECKDKFMKAALLQIIDANDTEKVRGMLDDSINNMCDRHEKGRAFFEKGIGMFPAFGMLGTLIGLIIMLDGLDNTETGGAASIGAGMAVALVTTFYGSLFANVIFAPISNSLKNAHDDEVLCMQIIEEGVIAIAEGSNPRYIEEKLEFMLPQKKGGSKEDRRK